MSPVCFQGFATHPVMAAKGVLALSGPYHDGALSVVGRYVPLKPVQKAIARSRAGDGG